jgi:hypothetical protein
MNHTLRVIGTGKKLILWSDVYCVDYHMDPAPPSQTEWLASIGLTELTEPVTIGSESSLSKQLSFEAPALKLIDELVILEHSPKKKPNFRWEFLGAQYAANRLPTADDIRAELPGATIVMVTHIKAASVALRVRALAWE